MSKRRLYWPWAPSVDRSGGSAPIILVRVMGTDMRDEWYRVGRFYFVRRSIITHCPDGRALRCVDCWNGIEEDHAVQVRGPWAWLRCRWKELTTRPFSNF